MLCSQTQSRAVTLLIVGVSLVLCGRAVAQESPPGAPVEEPGAVSGANQAPAEQGPDRVTKVFVIRHTTPQVLAQVLEVFPARFTYSRQEPQPLQALAVSASPAVMAAIEETITRLDKPPAPVKSIKLTAHILEALVDSPGTRRAFPEGIPDSAVPPVLEAVVAQLRETFRYQGYRLIETLIARTRGGSNVVVHGSGQSSSLRTIHYVLEVKRSRVTSGDGPSAQVRLEGLSFEVVGIRPSESKAASGLPGTVPVKIAGFDANIDVRQDQQVVVGKTGVGRDGDALILVLSTEVID